MSKVETMLGDTTYTLEDEPGLNMKLTRTNAQGVTSLYFPRALLGMYVADFVAREAKESFYRAFNK